MRAYPVLALGFVRGRLIIRRWIEQRHFHQRSQRRQGGLHGTDHFSQADERPRVGDTGFLAGSGDVTVRSGLISQWSGPCYSSALAIPNEIASMRLNGRVSSRRSGLKVVNRGSAKLSARSRKFRIFIGFRISSLFFIAPETFQRNRLTSR